MENKLIEDLLNKFNIDANEDIRYKLDSIKSIQLIMEIENIFKIEIKNIDFGKNPSVLSIIDEYTNHRK